MNVLMIGSPYPRPTTAKPLTAALFGLHFIKSESFEAAHFGLVPARNVPAVLASLLKVDLKKVAAAVSSADAVKLAEREVYDFEILASKEHPAKALVADIRGLTAFYRRAASRSLGVAMFTA